MGGVGGWGGRRGVRRIQGSKIFRVREGDSGRRGKQKNKREGKGPGPRHRCIHMLGNAAMLQRTCPVPYQGVKAPRRQDAKNAPPQRCHPCRGCGPRAASAAGSCRGPSSPPPTWAPRRPPQEPSLHLLGPERASSTMSWNCDWPSSCCLRGHTTLAQSVPAILLLWSSPPSNACLFCTRPTLVSIAASLSRAQC